jgi:hypothetical protein
MGGVGWLTNNGPATFGPGGHFAVDVQDAGGTPVEGWDFLQVDGALNVQSTNTNPFTIDLQSLDINGPDPVTNFSYNTNYDWTIASAGGITNFAVSAFAINDSQFQNDLAGGYFFVRTNSNSLVLSFTNNHPPSAGPTTIYRAGNVTVIPIATLALHWSDPDGDPVTLVTVDSSTNGGALGTDGSVIYYTNFNSVADVVSYTVSDVRTNPPAVYQIDDTVQTAVGSIIILPPASISGPSLSGTNFIFGSSNGIPGANYSVLASTNLTLPLINWSLIQTGSFDGNGSFQSTNNVDPAVRQKFYLLQLQ